MATPIAQQVDQHWRGRAGAAISKWKGKGEMIAFSTDRSAISRELKDLHISINECLHGSQGRSELYQQVFGQAFCTITRHGRTVVQTLKSLSSSEGTPVHVLAYLSNQSRLSWNDMWADDGDLAYNIGLIGKKSDGPNNNEFHHGYSSSDIPVKGQLKQDLKDSLGEPRLAVVLVNLQGILERICAIWVWVFLLLTVGAKITAPAYDYLYSLQTQSPKKHKRFMWVFTNFLPRYQLQDPLDPHYLKQVFSLEEADQCSPWPYLGQAVARHYWHRIPHIIQHLRGKPTLLRNLTMGFKSREDQITAGLRDVDEPGPTLSQLLLDSSDESGDRGKFGQDVMRAALPIFCTDWDFLDDTKALLRLSPSPDTSANAVELQSHIEQTFQNIDDAGEQYNFHYGPTIESIKSTTQVLRDEIKALRTDVKTLQEKDRKREADERVKDLERAEEMFDVKNQLQALQARSGNGCTELQAGFLRSDIIIKALYNSNDRAAGTTDAEYHNIAVLMSKVTALRNTYAHRFAALRPDDCFPFDARYIDVMLKHMFPHDQATRRRINNAFDTVYFIPVRHCLYLQPGLMSSCKLPVSLQFIMSDHMATIIHRANLAAAEIRCSILMPNEQSWLNRGWLLLINEDRSWVRHHYKQNMEHLALIPALTGLHEMYQHNRDALAPFMLTETLNDGTFVARFRSGDAAREFHQSVKNAIRNFTSQIERAIRSREMVVDQIKTTIPMSSITETTIKDHFEKLEQHRKQAITPPTNADLEIIGSFLEFYYVLLSQLKELIADEDRQLEAQARQDYQQQPRRPRPDERTLYDRDGQVLATNNPNHTAWSLPWWARTKDGAAHWQPAQADLVKNWPILVRDNDDGAITPLGDESPADT